METLFLKLLNMSFTACWIILAVVLLRFLLKKAPRSILCALWALAGIRLVFPFSFESVFSLVPKFGNSSPSFTVDVPDFDLNTVPNNYPVQSEPIIGNIDGETISSVADSSPSLMYILSLVWVVGMFILLVYALVSYLRLRKVVSESVCLDKNIYICDRIDSPFILGLILPKIYLPSTMSEAISESVIAHERAHLKRLDHIWKPLGFLILVVHWFNPLVWVAYVLLCRDIELACDESVIKNMSVENRKIYSTALLDCSIHRKYIAACPLAFGEVGVKERIKNILNYKKPAFWLILAAVLACFTLIFCFLTDPKDYDEQNIVGSNYKVKQVIVGDEALAEKYSITADFQLYSYDESLAEKWSKKGLLKKSEHTSSDMEKILSENVNIDEITDSYELRFGNAYYIVFKTVKAETYIAAGLAPNLLTELYLLEPELGKIDGYNYVTDKDFFARSVKASVGENVDPFHFYFSDNDFLVVGFMAGLEYYPEFQADMGYAIFTMHEDGYILKECYSYENVAYALGQVYICPDPAVLSEDGVMTDKNTYDVILSCNPDLSVVERTVTTDKGSDSRQVLVSGQKNMVLFRWADDKTDGEASVSIVFKNSEGDVIPYDNITPEGDEPVSEVIKAYSGSSNCIVYPFENETPLEEIKSKVNWLKIDPDEEALTPFDIYCGKETVNGMYYLYDAETFESIPFPHPSGLSPQTYILQNANYGKEYIVLFRTNLDGSDVSSKFYAFGIYLPEVKAETDPFAESDSPITWLKNVTVDDVRSVSVNLGGGDEFELGIRGIRSLISCLNGISDHSVYMDRGIPYLTYVTVECGERTYRLGFGGGITEISFDNETRKLYPQGTWQITDDNLSQWFGSLLQYGTDAFGEDEPTDFAIDFVRDFCSFYGREEVPEMDYGTYTDNQYLAEAVKVRREERIDRLSKHYKSEIVWFISSAEYIEGMDDGRYYVSVTNRIVSGKSNFGETFYLAIEKTDNGYDLSDIVFGDMFFEGNDYRYGKFGFFPTDDWTINGKVYLARIKGEEKIGSPTEIGERLLSEFESNKDNYKTKYKVYDVSFEDYFENYINPGYFLAEQAAEYSAMTKSQGVIIMFGNGRYIAYVGGRVIDPLIFDGTIETMYQYLEDEKHISMNDYFSFITESGCDYMDAKYIICLD